MTHLGLGRYMLGLVMAAAMLAACGGSQPPIGAPGLSRTTQDAQALNPLRMTFSEQASARGQYKATSTLMFVVNFSTSSGVGNVIVYDPATNDPDPLAVITKGIYSPNGDCVDGSGTLYVGNDPGSAGWVSEYAAGATRPSKTVTDGIDQPAFCTIDSQGNLWLANNGGRPNVTEYLEGSTKPHFRITKGLTYPIAVAIDRAGNVYIGNHVLYGTTNIEVYPRGSKSPSRTITDGVAWPSGIAVDAKGTLYVANDHAPCDVEKYHSGQSQPYAAITNDINGPTGLSVGKNGWLYVTNQGAQACSGPWPVVLEFRPDSTKPSGKTISKGLHTPVGNAYYPPLLP